MLASDEGQKNGQRNTGYRKGHLAPDTIHLAFDDGHKNNQVNRKARKTRNGIPDTPAEGLYHVKTLKTCYKLHKMNRYTSTQIIYAIGVRNRGSKIVR